MIDFGEQRPGTVLYIPFATFDGGTGASITMTGLAVTDIEVYKDGSVTQRASDTGYTLLDTDGTDLDAITGIQGFSIDLASDADAGFFQAGSSYYCVVSSITVDGQTVSFVAARWSIGYKDAIVNTTIATLASQTSFTLTSGAADNDAYNESVIVIHDKASAVQIAQGIISDYVGATKTVTLIGDPGIFTMAVGDNVSIRPVVNVGYIGGTGQTGTDVGALATTADLLDKVGAVDEAAAAGDPSSTESVMQYVKQIVNILAGAAGITTMPASAAPANNVSIAEMIRAIYDDTNELQSDDVPTLIGNLNDLSTTDLATAADNPLKVDTIPELAQAAPAATPTLYEAIMLLYMELRNVTTTTDAEHGIYNDAGTKVAKSTLTDDGTTFTAAEFVSGV